MIDNNIRCPAGVSNEAMSIKLKIFYPEIQRLVNNQNTVMVSGQTIGECLQDLAARYPGVEKWLYDKRGHLLKHVFVYVNAESLRKPVLTQPVSEMDELIMAVLLTGG
jgi:hypothetical protein